MSSGSEVAACRHPAATTHHVHVMAAHHQVTRAVMVHRASFGGGDGKREERSRESGEGGDFHVGTLEARTGLVRCALESTMRAIRFCGALVQCATLATFSPSRLEAAGEDGPAMSRRADLNNPAAVKTTMSLESRARARRWGPGIMHDAISKEPP